MAMRIKEVRCYVKDEKNPEAQGADCHDVEDNHWINGGNQPIANPMSGYPQYARYRKSWGINAMGSFVVEVEAMDGTTGVGVSIGGEPGCFIVEKHLSRFIEGEEVRNIEKMWDQMYRASTNYGRKGLTLQAISAVDLALWDLHGKVLGQPVFALLGGKTGRLPVYTTCDNPKAAKELGFVGVKIPCPYGPSDGEEGLRKNVETVAKAREEVGEDFPLMLDCYMALTVPYTIRLADRLKPYNLRWMEEFLHPDNYDGHKQVREALRSVAPGMMLTTGEHEYTRFGYKQLLEGRSVDIIQPDITWLGGLTEARRVVAMAAAFDVLCIPHGSSVYSYHLQVAFPNCPLAEFINLSPKGDTIVPYFGDLFEDEPLPSGGWIEVPERPGFGVTLRKEGLRRPYPRTPEESKAQFEKNVSYEPPTTPKMPF